MRIATLLLLLALSAVEGLAGCAPAAPAPDASPLRTAAERRAGVAVLLHRGCADLAPENTLDACELAFALGADGVEIDLRRTRDGTIVLLHDDWIDRVLDGWGRVADLSYEELLVYAPPVPNRRVATLREVLELCRRYHGLLHLDVKVPGIDADILRQIDEAGLLEHVVTVNAANAAALRADARVKVLPSHGSLIHGNDDYDMAAIRKKLAGAKAGTFLVDDPRAAIAALRRPAPDADAVVHRIPFSPAAPSWEDATEDLLEAALAPKPELPRRQALARLILRGAPVPAPAFEDLPEAVAADWLWAYARMAARGRRVPSGVGAAALATLLAADEEETLEAAAELAGETSEVEAVPILLKLLAEHAPIRALAADAPVSRIRMRAAAAKALGRIGSAGPEVLEGLRAAARDRSLHPDGAWQGLDGAMAVRALARLDPAGSASFFKRLALRVDPRLSELKQGAGWDFRIKSEAIRGLGTSGSPEAKAALGALLELSKEEADESWRELHADAARALCSGAWTLRPDELRGLLQHPVPSARRAAAAYLLDRYVPAYKALRDDLLPWAR
ncbi:MAG TPA: glycerophosphodiester phosphodiesterase family protein [Planctomycetota bacterium]